jgi:membrane protease YdiL (CAAX protease family)
MAEKNSASVINRVFFGPFGLRAGWRLLIFNSIFFLLSIGVSLIANQVYGSAEPDWTVQVFLIGRIAALVIALVSVWVMARIERRSFAQYGFTRQGAWGRLFWEGTFWGFLSVSAVVALISIFGGYSIRGLALQGGEIFLFTILWASAICIASVFEELVFRGYELFTLATGIRFWPAAIILSTVFGFYLHYVMKPNETWVDGSSVSLIALFFCLTVRRTGNLWFAIGWHFAFNFGSLFLFGFPNTGNKGLPVPQHFFDSMIHGPQWLTGGPMGAEASAFIFPVILILFLAFHFRFKDVRFPLIPEKQKGR